MELEKYFEEFRKQIIGVDQVIQTPYGEKKLIYADWIASGRLYRPIEEKLCNAIGPYVANTHSESSETGRLMTQMYQEAHRKIKRLVNANESDVIITTGYGMTSALAKFQRILGLKIPEKLMKYCNLKENERPVVFLTHMEHHSNHTPWLESLVDVVVLPPDENVLVNPDFLREEIKKYENRELKIGSFTACSNVTGIQTQYYELAEIMHENSGYCFVDFAASAPYTDINMHPVNGKQRLDAIFFSPHKFLGGPGSSGVLIFNKYLYKNRIPDHPGGGTVTWTNPWGEHAYFDDIEIREDGGTPGFLQAIKSVLCMDLKEKMGVENIKKREKELVNLAFDQLGKVPGLKILADKEKERIGVISFYIEDVHHNLIVRLLSDRFGVQVRGGCSCAGTYGHYLLHVDREKSHQITSLINQGDMSQKPGWVRISLHPTMTNEEVKLIADALKEISENHKEWMKEYDYSNKTNEFYHKSFKSGNVDDFLKV